MKLANNVKNFDVKGALEDCATIFENSTKAGFIMQRDPQGKRWARNPLWWERMKGQSTPLVGVTAGTQSKPSPPWVASGNREHMKNALMHRVTRTSAIVYYKGSVEDRAAINQAGGITEMEVFHFSRPDIKIIWKVRIQKREHLGIAESFKRIGGKTDPDHFEEMFLRKIERAIG